MTSSVSIITSSFASTQSSFHFACFDFPPLLFWLDIAAVLMTIGYVAK